MPLRQGHNKKGYYFKFGTDGTQYYFKPESDRSKSLARAKALKQGAAMHLTKEESKKSK